MNLNLFKISWGCLFFMYFIAFPLFGQTLEVDSTKQKPSTVGEEYSSSSICIEEIVITTIRADDKMPITQKVLQEADLQRDYTGQEMPIVLSKTPSITWYSDGGHFTGYSYMRLRGIDQTRINFTLNGMPLNEPEDQGAYFSNYPDFLNSVRSVQIQRGVGTSSNGTASFGGSVNFESPQLMDSSRFELQTSVGSFNTYRISPEYYTGLLKKKFAFYGRYSTTASDGFRNHSGTQGHSFFLSGGYFTKKGILKLTSFNGNSKSQMAYLAVSKEDIEKDRKTNYLSPDEKDAFTQNTSQLQYTHFVGKHTTLIASSFYTHLEGGYGILFGTDLYNYEVRSDFYGGMLNMHYEKKHWKLYSGIHANNYQRQHMSQVAPWYSQNLYSNSGYKQELSAFVKSTYDIGKFTLFVDAQGRKVDFKYVADRTFGQRVAPITWLFVNPKAGFTFNQNNRLSYYASVGKTSREPTRNDLFAGYDNVDSTNYAEIGDLTKVKPESVTDFELGTNYLSSKFHLQANVFAMEFRNEIAAIGQLSYIGLPLRKNVARSFRRGLELDFEWTPKSRFKIHANATLSHNEISEYKTDFDSVTHRNVQPLLTPSLIINPALGYNWNKVYAEVNGRYLGKSYLDNTQNEDYIVPESFVVNASFTIRPSSFLTINLMANNISDAKYYTSGYVQNAQSYYFAMAGRNYFTTLTFRF
jgi:iron complex outermembrane receptor protein